MLTSLFILMPVSLLLGGIALILFVRAIKGGWFEDVEGPKYRMLDDDPDDEPELNEQQLDLFHQERKRHKRQLKRKHRKNTHDKRNPENPENPDKPE